MAKLFASEAAEAIVSGALQTFGGMGYIRDTGIERIARDVHVCQIYEARRTSETDHRPRSGRLTPARRKTPASGWIAGVRHSIGTDDYSSLSSASRAARRSSFETSFSDTFA
ncbi:MAG: acyl-CoA dehydrogenase family protein [Paracoccaceae bacterium]